MALTFPSPACRLAVMWRVFCTALLHCYRVFSNDKSGGGGKGWRIPRDRYPRFMNIVRRQWGTTKISFFSNRSKLLSVLLMARRSLVNASTLRRFYFSSFRDQDCFDRHSGSFLRFVFSTLFLRVFDFFFLLGSRCYRGNLLFFDCVKCA